MIQENMKLMARMMVGTYHNNFIMSLVLKFNKQ